MLKAISFVLGSFFMNHLFSGRDLKKAEFILAGLLFSRISGMILKLCILYLLLFENDVNLSLSYILMMSVYHYNIF